MELKLSETRLKRVCEHHYQLKLLSRLLRVVTYTMDNVVENIMPEEA